MKTITQVVLPIAAVFGLVFGITFIVNYSQRGSTKQEQTGIAVKEPALRFPILTAYHDPQRPLLKYWRAEYEPNEEGHFEYWFQNSHQQEVNVRIDETNCQCAGADLGIVPKEVWQEYAIHSALAARPGGQQLSPILAAVALAKLNQGVQWLPLVRGSERFNAKVPAADPDSGPQMGMIRLHWTSKPEGEPSRTLRATVLSQLPGSSARADTLQAQFTVIDGARLYCPSTRTAELALGVIGAGEVRSGEVICWSATRPELTVSVNGELLKDAAPCVTWDPAVPLTDKEKEMFSNIVSPTGYIKIRTGYRVRFTVYERKEIEVGGKKELRQLDQGPLDLRVSIRYDSTTKELRMPITGIVRGDLRLVGDAVENDRVDMGTNFSNRSDQTRIISLFSDREGLDVELDSYDQNYFEKPLLTPQGERNGRREWRLQITIPAGKLSGSLPSDCAIYLKTKDATQRRIRIPIKGTAVDRGGLPRI